MPTAKLAKCSIQCTLTTLLGFNNYKFIYGRFLWCKAILDYELFLNHILDVVVFLGGVVCGFSEIRSSFWPHTLHRALFRLIAWTVCSIRNWPQKFYYRCAFSSSLYSFVIVIVVVVVFCLPFQNHFRMLHLKDFHSKQKYCVSHETKHLLQVFFSSPPLSRRQQHCLLIWPKPKNPMKKKPTHRIWIVGSVSIVSTLFPL